MKMNLKVRLKQKWFWITLIPMIFLLIDMVVKLVTTLACMTIGDALTGSVASELVVNIIGVVFAILALIGFPVDLTTEGYGDSEQALAYDKPKEK